MPLPLVPILAASAGANLLSSYFGNKSKADSERKALNFQRESRDIARGDMAPYRGLGDFAMPYLKDMATQGPVSDAIDFKYDPNFQESPGYKWQAQQGEKNLARIMAGRGLSNSGAEIQSLSDFYNSLGANEADKQYLRENDRYKRLLTERDQRNSERTDYRSLLAGLLNTGLGAASTTSGQAIQTGGMMSNLAERTGERKANMWSDIGNTASAGANAYAGYRGMTDSPNRYYMADYMRDFPR